MADLKGKSGNHFSLPSLLKEMWNNRANRRCCKVNAEKIIIRKINIAVPNSQDIQDISSSQRRANAPDSRRRHCLIRNVMLVTITSFSISRQEAWLRVCTNTLQCRWKCLIWRKLQSFETLSILRWVCSSEALSVVKWTFKGIYLHLPLTFLRWTFLDQLALSTDEGQLIARRCR